jgi:hypothetical protein
MKISALVLFVLACLSSCLQQPELRPVTQWSSVQFFPRLFSFTADDCFNHAGRDAGLPGAEFHASRHFSVPGHLEFTVPYRDDRILWELEENVFFDRASRVVVSPRKIRSD